MRKKSNSEEIKVTPGHREQYIIETLITSSQNYSIITL